MVIVYPNIVRLDSPCFSAVGRKDGERAPNEESQGFSNIRSYNSSSERNHGGLYKTNGQCEQGTFAR